MASTIQIRVDDELKLKSDNLFNLFHFQSFLFFLKKTYLHTNLEIHSIVTLLFPRNIFPVACLISLLFLLSDLFYAQEILTAKSTIIGTFIPTFQCKPSSFSLLL